jgi:hypothetical protein
MGVASGDRNASIVQRYCGGRHYLCENGNIPIAMNNEGVVLGSGSGGRGYLVPETAHFGLLDLVDTPIVPWNDTPTGLRLDAAAIKDAIIAGVLDGHAVALKPLQ